MKSDSGSAPAPETPTPLRDELPCFEVTVTVVVVAKDHDDAMEWTGDLLERVLEDDAVDVVSANVPREPVEYE